jgi:hypothetical protein
VGLPAHSSSCSNGPGARLHPPHPLKSRRDQSCPSPPDCECWRPRRPRLCAFRVHVSPPVPSANVAVRSRLLLLVVRRIGVRRRSQQRSARTGRHMVFSARLISQSGLTGTGATARPALSCLVLFFPRTRCYRAIGVTSPLSGNGNVAHPHTANTCRHLRLQMMCCLRCCLTSHYQNNNV